MQLHNTSNRYGAVSQSLHWLIALLVTALVLTGKVGDVHAEEGSAVYFWHSSLGVAVLLLIAVRIGWRLWSRAPRQPQTMSRLTGSIANGLHATFYVLLVALPVTGWLAASAEDAPVSLFGAVTIPAWKAETAMVPGKRVPGASATEEEEAFEEAHELLGNLLLILVAVHAVAALKHHFIDKDDVLARMLPNRRGSDGIH